MKKSMILLGIILCLVGFSQTLYRIDRPTKIVGWLSVQGDIWEIIHAKYDLGKHNYWFDSLWVEHGMMRSMLMVSPDSTDTLMVSPTRFVTDTLFAKYHMGSDASKADTFQIYDNGSVTYFKSENVIKLILAGNAVTWDASQFYSDDDTLRRLGQSSTRWKEVWGLRWMGSSPDKADTFKILDDGSDTYFDSDNPVVILNLAGSSGTNTFGGTKTADTTLIAGTTATDMFFIQTLGTTVWTQQPSCVARVNSLFVYCVVGDTAKARASGYNWARFKTK